MDRNHSPLLFRILLFGRFSRGRTGRGFDQDKLPCAPTVLGVEQSMCHFVRQIRGQPRSEGDGTLHGRAKGTRLHSSAVRARA